MTATAPQFRPMTEDERRMARALAGVTMIPGIPSKRFAGDIASEAASASAQISERQANALRSLVHRYRRQIPADVVALGQPIALTEQPQHDLDAAQQGRLPFHPEHQ
ncbi:MAG: hypothetical protein WD825_17260 [Gemmatimonadaceae bacterium]